MANRTLKYGFSAFHGVLKDSKVEAAQLHAAGRAPGEAASGKGKGKGKPKGKAAPPVLSSEEPAAPKGVIHQGTLGIQHAGQLTNKHFVLYKDCLDYHDNREDADAKVRPRGRIALAEVSSYEAYGNGFILKLLGRSVGLHVGQDVEAGKLWEQSLKQALLECTGRAPANTSNQSRGAKGAKKGASRSASSTASAALASSGEMSDLQRAFGYASAGSLSGPSGPGEKTMVQNDSVTRLSVVPVRRMNFSPHRRNGNSASSQSGNGDWVRAVSVEHRTRKEDGKHWRDSSIDSAKINQSSRDEKWVLPRSTETLPDKVTGDRTDGIRVQRNARNASLPSKEGEGLTPRTKVSINNGQHSKTIPWDITGKVNEEGRTYLKPINRPDACYFAGKVTGPPADRYSSRGRDMFPDKAAGQVHRGSLFMSA